MTSPRQGNGGPDGRPLCFNREPRIAYIANDGFDEEGWLRTKSIPWRFSTECKSWASHPGSDPVPLAEGWKCIGCRHYPATLVAEALIAQEARG